MSPAAACRRAVHNVGRPEGIYTVSCRMRAQSPQRRFLVIGLQRRHSGVLIRAGGLSLAVLQTYEAREARAAWNSPERQRGATTARAPAAARRLSICPP